jgi:hypothetical protein
MQAREAGAEGVGEAELAEPQGQIGGSSAHVPPLLEVREGGFES